MNYKYGYDKKLIIIDIKDKTKASHLEGFIGSVVEVISRMTHNNERKYKVIIDGNSNDTYYFLEEELEYLRVY